MHSKDVLKIVQLECEKKKVEEENNKLIDKLKNAEMDIKYAQTSWMMLCEWQNKIGETLYAKENGSDEKELNFFQKLSAKMAKIMPDATKKIELVSKWNEEDVNAAVNFFEKSMFIVQQENPQFETLVEMVAAHNEKTRSEVRQVH
ncbi:hypothetical protein WUBG_16295 [Wuchereria bancrofti]|uniref:Uncharacterized protein n=1 Tax=Wuchereria bancrofti TaxID=6293 RepID=J9EBM2_WUCBA|nr:hypothetical protein WUBG_16295 [Wuchereria bancrofti]VDM15239.1 unnamed protein product [Wuchereria bancrofti]